MSRRLSVALDVSNAIDPRPTGVARYIHGLIDTLRTLDAPIDLTLYCRPSRRRRGDPHAVAPDLPLRWLGPRVGRTVDVFHAPDARAPRWCAPPLVVTLHDLSALDRSDHATPKYLEKKRREYQRAARDAAHLITHTHTVAGEIAARLDVPTERVTPVPLADSLPIVADRNPPREDRLLTVGGPSVRKGSLELPEILTAWERELDWTPQIDWVGSGSDADAEHFLGRLAPAARARVRFRGHVSDRELDELYHRAQGLLVLSPTEGFGIPLLEAARRGCPLLAVRSATLIENWEPHAFWFEAPYDRDLSEVRAYLDPATRAERASAAQRHAESFSWERTARETVEAYERACAIVR